MYNIACNLPLEREPWNISLESRRQKVLNGILQGKKVAVMIYEQADTSTFRYRCYNVMQALKISAKWDSVYFFMNELDTVYSLLPDISLLILIRIRWTHDIDTLIQRAHVHHIKVLFDVDDLVCNTQYLKLVTNTLNVHFGGNVDYDFWFAYISRMEYTASRVDGFIVTNPYLGEKLQSRFGKPYQIVINSLNQEQLKVSEMCCQCKEKLRKSKPYTLGYFSGTPSHINDFKIIAPEMIQLLNDYPEMVLQVVGFMEFPESMRELINKKRVRFTPLVDFVELQKKIAEVDVNIVPLVQNSFTNCKSELKFFEAAVVNVPTLATPIYTYKNAIEDGKTGFLCEPGQWYENVVKLYNEPALSREISQNAYTYCMEHYTGKRFRKQIEDSYSYFAL